MYSISAGAIARAVVLGLALINQGLVIAGYSPIPIEDDTLTEVVSLIFLIVTSVISWWKNNGFTKSGQMGNEVIDAIDHGILALEEVEELLDSKKRD